MDKKMTEYLIIEYLSKKIITDDMFSAMIEGRRTWPSDLETSVLWDSSSRTWILQLESNIWGRRYFLVGKYESEISGYLSMTFLPATGPHGEEVVGYLRISTADADIQSHVPHVEGRILTFITN